MAKTEDQSYRFWGSGKYRKIKMEEERESWKRK